MAHVVQLRDAARPDIDAVESGRELLLQPLGQRREAVDGRDDLGARRAVPDVPLPVQDVLQHAAVAAAVGDVRDARRVRLNAQPVVLQLEVAPGVVALPWPGPLAAPEPAGEGTRRVVAVPGGVHAARAEREVVVASRLAEPAEPVARL